MVLFDRRLRVVHNASHLLTDIGQPDHLIELAEVDNNTSFAPGQ